MLKKISVLLLCFFNIQLNAQDISGKSKQYNLNGFQLELSPIQQDKGYWAAISEKALKNSGLRQKLGNDDYLVLGEELIQSDNFSDAELSLTIYNYTKNKCLLIKVTDNSKNTISISESNDQPDPSQEEYEKSIGIFFEAVPQLKEAYHEKKISFYKPMPPLDFSQLNNGVVQRTVTLGIESMNNETINEIVGINMITKKVIHYKNGAPPFSRIDAEQCGIPNARQGTTKRLKGDTYELIIKKQGSILWKMLVTRPRSSSGNNASGVEIQNVFYKGKSVLKQAHVPVLNVSYDSNKCGPYRDWLYEESYFMAEGETAGDGFMICDKKPNTLFDVESDTGNFRGVAIYATDSTISLTSETEAGWYRYIMVWQFSIDGTILPIFEFAAVKNGCVCNIHHHHVYWRFDFDIDSANNNQVAEFNKGAGWKNINKEERRINDTGLERKWRIYNTQTKAAYTLIPGANDGVQDDAFGIGDVWVLHNNGKSEIDDGVKQYSRAKKENIDKYLTNESTANTDIVLWYAAHFTHDVHGGAPETVEHLIGPKLICTNWPALSKTESIQYSSSKK